FADFDAGGVKPARAAHGADQFAVRMPRQRHLGPNVVDRIEHQIIGRKVKAVDPRFVHPPDNARHPFKPFGGDFGLVFADAIAVDLAVLVGHVEAIAVHYGDIRHTAAPKRIQAVAAHAPRAKEDDLGPFEFFKILAENPAGAGVAI